MTYYPPSVDPANLDTLTGAFREIMGKSVQYTDGMLPAQVIAVNGGVPITVAVQPLVMLVATDGSAHSRAPIFNVPVMQLGGGGCVLTFPLAVGDVGFILANDRDISQFITDVANFTVGENPPNTYRMKTFSDAIFMPAVLSGYSVAGSGVGATLQTADGTVGLVISKTGVQILGPVVFSGDVTMNGTVTTSAQVTMNGPTVEVTGGLTVTGTNSDFPAASLYIEGNVQATGTITP
jgi:hypothetical protein